MPDLQSQQHRENQSSIHSLQQGQREIERDITRLETKVDSAINPRLDRLEKSVDQLGIDLQVGLEGMKSLLWRCTGGIILVTLVAELVKFWGSK